MGNGEGSSVGGATRRKEGAQARSCHAEEDGVGGAGRVWRRQGHAVGGGGARSVMCEWGGEGGARGPCVKAWAGRGKEGARPGPREQCQF
jgi:hypothetical protein